MTELRGSVEGVRTAMTTGEVEVTSDITTVKGETCELGQVGTENQELEEVDEVYKIKEEHTRRTGEGHWGRAWGMFRDPMRGSD